MASSGSGYDLSASTFSPDGRIFQVEYATKAVSNAGTCLGIHANNGIVMGVAKPLVHKMIVPTTASYKRIHTIDTHVGVSSTGFLPDARVLVTRAMEEASDYKEHYGCPIAPHVLADRLGYYVHYFTLHGYLRPFGASCVLGGYDTEMKQYGLYMIEPNGAAYQYYGVACGKGKQVAKTELEKLNLHKQQQSGGTDESTTMDVKQAVKEITKILMLLHQDNKDNDGKPMELELSWICEESKFNHVNVPKDIINEAKTWATEQLEEEDDDDDDDEEGGEAMEEG